ncbi:DUF982 domain-containing protein [Mesorhizobium sp. WSM2239]|uniref:DUF982 domain-containing protein n=2 Tax=unclassified Mesorhizobium TaxID=325217 RepID=A0AAU8DB42_9HYPH
MARLEDRPFDEYVTIKAGRGQRQNISSARQAAEWLLYKWPTEEDTDKAWRARKACHEALQGKVETAACHQAFRVAAEEAGILIGNDRRPAPKPKKRKR